MPEYNLGGSPTRPQVSPEASYWLRCPSLKIVSLDEVQARIDNQIQPYFSNESIEAQVELQELQQFFQDREDVNAFDQNQLSLFLRDARYVSPPPAGAVLNRRPGNLPIIKNGGELARLFENETPGLWHRHVLNVLFDPNIPNSLGQRFSPPLQAFIWAALDVAIASALMAVWHYKWLATGLNQVARRARPVEANPGLGVLYDFEVKFDTTGQNGRQVGDIILGQPKNEQIASPGTPRHPAYGSGHSTYSAAASYVLGELLPTFRNDFNILADNIGIARLWGGVHWRSDHEAGQLIARRLAA